MKARLQNAWLTCQILCWRWGWAWWLVLAMVLQALLLSTWLLPAARTQRQSLETQLAGLRQRGGPVAPDRPALEQAIADAHAPMDWWSRAQLLAAGQELKLPNAEFTHAFEFGAIERMNVVLPVSGSYLGVRGLVVDLLRDAPTLGIDAVEMSFVAPGEVKASLTLSYWHPRPAAAAEPPTGRRP